MTSRKLIASIVAPLMVAIAMIVAVPSAAHADVIWSKCTRDYSGIVGNEYIEVCPVVEGNQVGGYVALYSSSNIIRGTMYVAQCRVDITHCVTITATPISQADRAFTSLKPSAHGHVYHTCVSAVTMWGDQWPIVNLCSKWIAL
jgi:hypothetical protein